MFTFWGLSNTLLILFSLSAAFLGLFSVFYWILLELVSWSIFFMFSLSWGKNALQSLFSFFVIQGICSIVWLSGVFFLSLEDHNFSVYIGILVFSILLVKMGLFPGHFWAWQIYNKGMIWPTFSMAVIQKLLPLILMSSVLAGGEVMLSEWLLSLSMILVFLSVTKVTSLFSFFFVSGLVHYSAILMMLSWGEVILGEVYFLSYLLTSVVFFFLLEKKKVFFLNPSQKPKGGSIWGVIWGAILGGFPPSIMFFLKSGFLMHSSSSQGIVGSAFVGLLLGMFFLYAFFIMSSMILSVSVDFPDGEGILANSPSLSGDLSFFLIFMALSTYFLMMMI